MVKRGVKRRQRPSRRPHLGHPFRVVALYNSTHSDPNPTSLVCTERQGASTVGSPRSRSRAQLHPTHPCLARPHTRQDNSTKVGQSWPHLSSSLEVFLQLVQVVRLYPISDTHRSNSGRLGPTFCQAWPRFARLWPISVELCQKQTWLNLGPTLAQARQTRRNTDHVGTGRWAVGTRAAPETSTFLAPTCPHDRSTLPQLWASGCTTNREYL